MFSGGHSSLGPDGRPHELKGWALLLCIFFSEHIFLVVRLVVRTAIGKLDSENMRKERSERFLVRKKYLEESGLSDAVNPLSSPPQSSLKATAEENGGNTLGEITRASLEDDARNETLKDATPATKFWDHQRSPRETEKVGLSLIDMMDLGEDSKKSK